MNRHQAPSPPERGHQAPSPPARGHQAPSPPERGHQQLRASDSEREQAAAVLREHAAAGRLTIEELDERAQAAFAARTRSDLSALFEDLPGEPAIRAVPSRAKARAHSAHVRVYLLVSLGLVAIWALSGAGYFWPVWPIMGWGIGVASHTASWRTACARARHTTIS
jgi:Domain of unknown function (DUF1707)/2TM domain